MGEIDDQLAAITKAFDVPPAIIGRPCLAVMFCSEIYECDSHGSYRPGWCREETTGASWYAFQSDFITFQGALLVDFDDPEQDNLFLSAAEWGSGTFEQLDEVQRNG